MEITDHYNNDIYADVVIELSDGLLYANKIILLQSEYFKTRFDSKLDELKYDQNNRIIIKDFITYNPVAFKAVIKTLYTKIIPIKDIRYHDSNEKNTELSKQQNEKYLFTTHILDYIKIYNFLFLTMSFKNLMIEHILHILEMKKVEKCEYIFPNDHKFYKDPRFVFIDYLCENADAFIEVMLLIQNNASIERYIDKISKYSHRNKIFNEDLIQSELFSYIDTNFAFELIKIYKKPEYAEKIKPGEIKNNSINFSCYYRVPIEQIEKHNNNFIIIESMYPLKYKIYLLFDNFRLEKDIFDSNNNIHIKKSIKFNISDFINEFDQMLLINKKLLHGPSNNFRLYGKLSAKINKLISSDTKNGKYIIALSSILDFTNEIDNFKSIVSNRITGYSFFIVTNTLDKNIFFI